MSDPNLTFYHNFAVNQTLDARIGPPLGIIRTTSATFFNSGGLIETASTGVARFEYDPITRISLGLLVEEARTNVALQAREFDTTWSNLNTVVLTQDQVGIDGKTNQAWTLEDDSTVDESIRQNITIPDDSNTHVFPIYLLKDSDTTRFPEIALSLEGGSSPAGHYHVNTSTGAITLRFGAGTNTGIVTDAGLWWRVAVAVANDTSANVTAQLILRPAGGTIFGTSDTNATGSVVGDAAQLELNASFPTSFIDTTTASVTRNADVVSTTDMSWLNASAGTFYADFSTGNIDNDTTVFSIHDGTANERIAVEITGGNIHFIGVDTTTQWDISTAATADTDYKLAVAWATNDIAFYLNGAQIGVDGLATLPTLTTLNIGSDHADAEFLNSHFREGRGYNVRKDNTFLEGLSNGIINEDSINLSTNLARPIVRKLARPH